MKERLTIKGCKEFYSSAMEKKLCEYEDAEEQGLLVKLPCKVGDKIFYVNKYIGPLRIEEFKVSEIVICSAEDAEDFELRFVLNDGDAFLFYSSTTDDVYFTRPEAEKRLAELKGEK